MADKPNVSKTTAYWSHAVGDPTGPVAQFRMAQLVDYDRRLTDPAKTVYRFLIGWYIHSKGDALASVRHIVSTMRGRAPDGARHLSRSAVQRAIILLINTGWLVRTRVGKGRSGSRYVPVLNVLELASQGSLPSAEIDSVPLYRDTTEGFVASHSTGTPLSHSTGTLQPITSHSTGTKTLPPVPRTDAATGKGEKPEDIPGGGTTTTSRSPDGGGCGGAATGFDELYDAYAVRKDRAKAKAVYEKLAPDADTHDAMVEAAHEWRATYDEQDREAKWRKRLHNWIEGECWLEDPPEPRQHSGGAAKPEPIAEPETPSTHPLAGRHTMTVIGSDIDSSNGTAVTFHLRLPDGRELSDRIEVESTDQYAQHEGQAKLSALCLAAGLTTIEDSEELHGAVLAAMVGQDGAVIYKPAAANDDKPQGASVAAV